MQTIVGSVLQLVGLGSVVAGVTVVAGLAGGLVASGVALLVVGVALERN